MITHVSLKMSSLYNPNYLNMRETDSLITVFIPIPLLYRGQSRYNQLHHRLACIVMHKSSLTLPTFTQPELPTLFA